MSEAQYRGRAVGAELETTEMPTGGLRFVAGALQQEFRIETELYGLGTRKVRTEWRPVPSYESKP